MFNIALIRSRYDPFGGAERFVENALHALAAEGVRLTVIARSWSQKGATNSGAEVLIVDPFYLGSVSRDRQFARAVSQALALRKFDLVQSHERIPGCDVYRAGDGVHAEWLTQRSRAAGPLRRLGIALNPHHRYLLDAERALFGHPKLRAVICNSRMVMAEIRTHFGTPEEKLALIYNAVDGEKFNPRLRGELRGATRDALGISGAAPVFLFVGSGFERKGLDVFLRAFAVQDSTAHAIVVGKDKRAPAYRSLAGRLGIAARVHFTGGVSDVRRYYAAADVFGLPTLYDPLPNAALEAMACGLPAVVSTKCGAAELIVEGENGSVVDALDVAANAAAMRACAAASERMGAAAHAAMLSLTPARMAAEYLALYRRLLRAT